MPDINRTNTIAIIGAGPAGLIAAEHLARAGHAIHIYDRKPSPARKFLMAGRGGLNITHSEPLETFITRYGVAQDFMRPLINAFTPDDMRTWCHDLGQDTFIGSSGRVFPKTLKASPLLRAWLARLDTLGVQFHLRHDWHGWNDDGALAFNTPDGAAAVQSDATLLALGGASWPGLGSDGSWVDLLSARGVGIAPLRPSNCGFHVNWSDYFSSRFAGQPLKNITLSLNDKSVSGEIMIDARGIEGGAVYALSAPIRDALPVTISIDLHPNITTDKIIDKMNKAPRGRQSFSTWMKKVLNLSPLSIALLHEADKDVGTRDVANLAALIKSLPLPVTAPFDIDRAISSAGGITLDEVDDNMMLCAMPGVFAAGEVLDWEAPTGGYLLQGCFATGIAAARGIEHWLATQSYAAHP